MAFCFYCAGELTPPGATATLGRCVKCGTGWERVYSRECPGCGWGWVHLHHPDEVVDYEDEWGSWPAYAMGYGWCDECDTHVAYEWYFDYQKEHVLSLYAVGEDAGREEPHFLRVAKEVIEAA